MRWSDASRIAEALAALFPDIDPLSVRFTDLRRWVAGLEGFEDDPMASSEGTLEAIQMAWYDESSGR